MTTIDDKLKKNPRVILEVLLVAVVLFLLWNQFYPQGPSVQSPSLPGITAPSKTVVTVEPKTSPSDDDVVVTRQYTANIDGQRLTIPFKTTGGSPGVKGVITQEIDFTPVVQQMAKAQEKNWSIAVGVGVHEGDLYIPLEVEKVTKRTPKADHAVAVEVHVKPAVPLKVTGGELKYRLRF